MPQLADWTGLVYSIISYAFTALMKVGEKSLVHDACRYSVLCFGSIFPSPAFDADAGEEKMDLFELNMHTLLVVGLD